MTKKVIFVTIKRASEISPPLFMAIIETSCSGAQVPVVGDINKERSLHTFSNEDGITFTVARLDSSTPIEYKRELTEALWNIGPSKKVLIQYKDWEENHLRDLLQARLGTKYGEHVTLIGFSEDDNSSDSLKLLIESIRSSNGSKY